MGLVSVLIDAVAVVINPLPPVLIVIDVVVHIDRLAAHRIDVSHDAVTDGRIGTIEGLAVALLLGQMNRKVRCAVGHKLTDHLELLSKQRSPQVILPGAFEVGTGNANRISAPVDGRTDDPKQNRFSLDCRFVGKDQLRCRQQILDELLVIQHVTAGNKLGCTPPVKRNFKPAVLVGGNDLEHVEPRHVICHVPFAHVKRLQMLVLQHGPVGAKQRLRFKVQERLLGDHDHAGIPFNGAVDLLFDVLGVVAGDGSAKCTVFLSKCQRRDNYQEAGVFIGGHKSLVVGAFAFAAASGVYSKHKFYSLSLCKPSPAWCPLDCVHRYLSRELKSPRLFGSRGLGRMFFRLGTVYGSNVFITFTVLRLGYWAPISPPAAGKQRQQHVKMPLHAVQSGRQLRYMLARLQSAC